MELVKNDDIICNCLLDAIYHKLLGLSPLGGFFNYIYRAFQKIPTFSNQLGGWDSESIHGKNELWFFSGFLGK